MFVLALALSLTSVAFAQTCGGVGQPPCSPITGGSGIDNTGANIGEGIGNGINDTEGLVGTIMGLVNWMAWAVGLAAVVMGLYAGILFITAGGDSAKVTTARNILLYAIIGIAVAILAFSLVAISQSLFSLS